MKAPTTDIFATPFPETTPKDPLSGAGSEEWIMRRVKTGDPLRLTISKNLPLRVFFKQISLRDNDTIYLKVKQEKQGLS